MITESVAAFFVIVLRSSFNITLCNNQNIKFENKYLERDQGKALNAIWDEFQMIYLCLNHIFTSFKKFDYSYELELFVKYDS